MNQTDKLILNQTYNPTSITTTTNDQRYNNNHHHLGMITIDTTGYYGIINDPINTMNNQNGLSYLPEAFQMNSNWDYQLLNDYLFQTLPTLDQMNPTIIDNTSEFNFELYSSTIDLMNDPYHPIPSDNSPPNLLMDPITTYLSDEEDQRSDPSTDPTHSPSNTIINTTSAPRRHGLPASHLPLPPGLTTPRPKPTLLSSDPNHPLYPCQYCHQPFSRRNSLRRHEQLHTGTKPYQCLPCHRNFSRQDIYKRHRASKRCRKLTNGNSNGIPNTNL